MASSLLNLYPFVIVWLRRLRPMIKKRRLLKIGQLCAVQNVQKKIGKKKCTCNKL